MRNRKVTRMVQTAILIALIILMAFTPLGFIRTAGLEIQLIMIPVVIGAMLLGPGAGAIFGFTFGALSFIQCFGMSPFGAALLGINPIFTFLVCVPTRMLAGYLTGTLFGLLKKMDKTKILCYFVTGLSGAVLNTVFFMGTLMLFFWKTDFMQNLNANGLHVMAFIVFFVGLNGLLEWPVTCIVSGITTKALHQVFRNGEIA